MDTVSKNIVFEQMKRHSCAVYFIFSGDEKLKYASQEDEQMSIEQSIELLSIDLEQCYGRFVIVEIRQKLVYERGGNTRDKHIYKFRVSTIQSQDNNKLTSQPDYNRSLFKEIQQLKIDLVKQDYERKLEKLEEEKKALKAESKNPMIEQAANIMLTKFLQIQNNTTKQPIQGIITNDDKIIIKERVNKSLKILKKFDPDFTALEALANFADKEPEQFKTFMTTFLKSEKK